MKRKRVLIVYYSFTQQTRLLLKKFSEGLEDEGVEVTLERLEPVIPYSFPFKTNLNLAEVMVRTFFRQRTVCHPIAEHCFDQYDCVVLAGPTWSYHPSGPILEFIDQYAKKVCGGRLIVPLISCRSYWRLHYWSLKKLLVKVSGRVTKPLVFTHPTREPWRFIGLVLQLRGKMVRKDKSWFRRHYPGYGHNKEQGERAKVEGRLLASKLLENKE